MRFTSTIHLRRRAAAAVTVLAAVSVTMVATTGPAMARSAAPNFPQQPTKTVYSHGRLVEVDYRYEVSAAALADAVRPFVQAGVSGPVGGSFAPRVGGASRATTTRTPSCEGCGGPVGGQYQLTPTEAWHAYGLNKTIGGNKFTDYGKATMTDIHQHGTQPGATYDLDVRFACSSACAAARTAAARSQMHPHGIARTNSWYDPSSWDWSGWLGDFWKKIVTPCLKGAAKGVVGTISGVGASKVFVWLFSRGSAAMKLNPEGLAVSAIAGCAVSVFSN